MSRWIARQVVPPVSRSPHVLNDSFRSSGVLNDSFKTLEHRCGPHRRDFAGPLREAEAQPVKVS
ncbi:hypothetical protein H4696_004507 [Amycolatopsis lexingtonensis]|uniref:Uncharacterized protein n=1 Tax=Amycolatopsis lexingtonensis TaxID=218822 RepID=A0ABR9I3A5_9PSEU|nr:hypothetical protein [Amycolatopsis lexingtonensis]